MKKLFNVTLETELVVVAETVEEAEDIALRVPTYELGDSMAANAHETTYLPDDWEEDALPFGENKGDDIGQWISSGGAPALLAQRERMAKIQERLAKRAGDTSSPDGESK
jgi:hypothetical protein